jgi:hypothetical protein
MVDSHVKVITSKVIESIDCNFEDIQRSKSFKIRMNDIPGKYYLDRISGCYEDSLHNLIHKIMWYEGIYKKIIQIDSEMKIIEAIIKNEPDGIYKPDVLQASTEEEEIILENLEDKIDLIYFESIMYIKNYLQKFSHFDADQFTANGY